MVANKDTIVLDSTNNVLVGPNGYFKVVIDSFDGTTVKAWHFEDPKGNKSDNLAASAKGKHIDLLVTKGNRTIQHFITRYADRFYKENEAAKAEVAKLQTAAADAQKAVSDKDADAQKKLAEKDAAIAKAAADLKPVQDAAKAAQDKTTQLNDQVAQLQKTAKDLQTQLDAKAGHVDPTLPYGVAAVGVLAALGTMVVVRRKPKA